MIAVIMAGGSGTRLWPLSTPAFPKHLLKVNGDSLSLLQHTYQRAKLLTDKVYVVSESGHIQHVKRQLPELPDESFIAEPARRGTASCIVASLAYIANRHSVDEPIAFIGSDHYIRDNDGFSYSFKIASDVTQKTERIVLVGAEPDYPSTGFGYIQKGDRLNGDQLVFNVQSFKEKPQYDTAQLYIRSGNYLWNCNYFVGSLKTFLKNMQIHAPELFKDYQRLTAAPTDQYVATYLAFENHAIDYALIEKVDDLLVVPASFDWMDLGSFKDMYKVVERNESGNHLHGDSIEVEEVKNSFIQNYESKPLAVIGLDNVIVINTPDGILVARKDLSQKVGDVSKRFRDEQ